MLSKIIGIPSWLPDKEPDRTLRINRLEGLLNQLNTLWPEIPLLIIAQNWKNYNIKNTNIKANIYRYDKLGILRARKELRKKFLELNFDYLIMFDDDAIIKEELPNSHILYMEELDRHPEGFCFIKRPNGNIADPYYPSQLNLCAISRPIYLKEDMVNVDAQKDEGFEDRLFSSLLHIKYSDKEFDAPNGIRCAHFKNPELRAQGKEAPSTWAGERRHSWRYMVQNTDNIVQYIIKYKDLPSNLKPQTLSILVTSCDKNQDLFEPFHYCMEKYWPDHPEIIYSTESINNPFYRTISKNYNINEWTRRVKETAQAIESNYILVMCDDIFLRQKVDSGLIDSLPKYFDSLTAALNFEPKFDRMDIPINNLVSKRSLQGRYKTSVMCQLWAKDKLLQVFDCNCDPWQFEQLNQYKGFKYLISNEGKFLDWGKSLGKDWRDWGIYQGKWAPSTKEFFDKEGLKIDYSVRGIAELK